MRTLARISAAAIMATAACAWGMQPPKATPDPAPQASRPAAVAVETTTAVDAATLAKAQQSVDKGLNYLLACRNADGGWGFAPDASHPGLTAMALKAFLQSPRHGPGSDVAEKAVASLMKYRQSDGGFYDPREGNQNYVTSLAVMALARAGPKHRPALVDAVKFLRGLQIVPGSKTPAGEEVGEGHPYDGGVSYGRQGRPDLSNQGMWMQAMHDAGVSGDDPAMKRALAFVKRLQNRSEGTEGQAFVLRGVEDGGFVYAIGREGDKFVGESKAGTARRGLRSYGSMTYTGFKSMLHADVDHKDPRVKAAFDWIRRYWRLDSNPNMPAIQSRQGLYYYYHVFAKALRAWGQDQIEDTAGVKHNWRAELIGVLGGLQAADGSWVNNDEERWFEGNPILATCYAVNTLQEAVKK